MLKNDLTAISMKTNVRIFEKTGELYIRKETFEALFGKVPQEYDHAVTVFETANEIKEFINIENLYSINQTGMMSLFLDALKMKPEEPICVSCPGRNTPQHR